MRAVTFAIMYISFLISLFLTFGCGQNQDIPFNTVNNKSATCNVTVNSTIATITCPDGSTANVSNGTAGVVGPQGIQGVSGQPGTSITVIQFCPGYTPAYPSVFPEIGLDIGGQIYALFYSPPSSGLTLLTPGAYTSTQTSAPCNFTVNTDGTITN